MTAPEQIRFSAARFRILLISAMMLVIASVTGLVLWFSEDNLRKQYDRALEFQFMSRRSYQAGRLEARRAAVQERCRALSRSVRIRAALEEGEIEDLYRNAAIEMRDILSAPDPESDQASAPIRAKFFRFVGGDGKLLVPGDTTSEDKVLEDANLAVEAQQSGFLAFPTGVMEVIATPVHAPDTGELLGVLLLGLSAEELVPNAGEAGVQTGVYLGEKLYMPGLSAGQRIGLTSIVPETAAASGTREVLLRRGTEIEGREAQVFFQKMPTGSRFPPTFQVAMYPATDSVNQLRELRLRVLSAAGIAMVGALFGIGLITRRLTDPVAMLAEHSSEHLAAREIAEAAREVSEQRYESIFQNAAEGIFILEPDGSLLTANPSMARLFGFESPADLLGESSRLGAFFAESGDFAEFVRRAALEPGVVGFETEVIRKDGRRIWLRMNARPVLDEIGLVTQLEGMIEDITERKRSEAALIALNQDLERALQTLKDTQQQVIEQERLRALGQMASGIAHDFNMR